MIKRKNSSAKVKSEKRERCRGVIPVSKIVASSAADHSLSVSVKKSRIDRDIYLRELTLLKKQISNMESRYNNVLKENQFLWKTFMNSKKQQDEMKRQMERICKFISKLTTSNRILDNSDDFSQYVRFLLSFDS